MSKLDDLKTERIRISNLTKDLVKLRQEREDILLWVEKKQAEYDIFEEKASKLREELNTKKNKVNNLIEQHKELETKNRILYSQICKEKGELNKEKLELNSAINTNKKESVRLEQNIKKNESILSEVNHKLRIWNNVKKTIEGLK